MENESDLETDTLIRLQNSLKEDYQPRAVWLFEINGKYIEINRKYILTTEKLEHEGVTLYRIQASKDFSDVKKGDLGGWIQSEDNLSHVGDCWIYDQAKVCGNAKIDDNAQVHNNAVISCCENVGGEARIFDNVDLGDAMSISAGTISGNAKLYKRVKDSYNKRFKDSYNEHYKMPYVQR